MNPLCTLSIFPFISFSKRKSLSEKSEEFLKLNEKLAHRIGSLRLSKKSVTIDGDLGIEFYHPGGRDRYDNGIGPCVFEYPNGEQETHETPQDFFSFHLERPGTKIGLMILEDHLNYLDHLQLYTPFTIQLKLTLPIYYFQTHKFFESLSGREVKHLMTVPTERCDANISHHKELKDIKIKKLTLNDTENLVDPEIFQYNIPLIHANYGPTADPLRHRSFEELIPDFIDGNQGVGSFVNCHIQHPDRIAERGGGLSALEAVISLTEDFGFQRGYLRHLECLWKPMNNNLTAYCLFGFRSDVGKFDSLQPFHCVKLICLEEKPTQHRSLEMKILHWISAFQFLIATTYIHQFWGFLHIYMRLKKATLVVDLIRFVERHQLPILLFLSFLLCLPGFLLVFGFTLFNFLLYLIIMYLFQWGYYHFITRKFPEWVESANFADMELVMDPDNLPSVEPLRED